MGAIGFIVVAFVYILQSDKNDRYYIGCTENLERRLEEHRSGKVYFTKRILPLKLVFKQECPNMPIARKVEEDLKSLKRKDYIEKIIKDGRIKLLNRYLRP